MTTEIHDTYTCPCEMCVWARETAANKPKSSSEAYHGHLRLDTGRDLAVEGTGNPQPDPQDLFRAPKGVISPQTPNSTISVNGHLLYTEQNCSVFHDSDKQCPIHEGELAVCRLCNEYEAGLDHPCQKSQLVIVVVPPTFTEEWESAPRWATRTTEIESAEYWFLRGVRAGETGAMVTMNEDLREIRRVAAERIEQR